MTWPNDVPKAAISPPPAAPAAWSAGRSRRRNSAVSRSEEHTSELQSPCNLVCRLLLEKKKYQLTKTDLPGLSRACLPRRHSLHPLRPGTESEAPSNRSGRPFDGTVPEM